MQLYLDIIKDAAAQEILVNCHGATIPRGWDRTWPNLMTMEAVRGYEHYTFRQDNADRAASHCCIVPFTRNVVGPMDFTPTFLGKHLNPERTIERRTTQAFELASSVVYESGIQHFGLTPDDVEQAPEFVLEFLRALPRTWDEIRFIDGFPSRYVVLARRAGEQWFIAGLNGEDQPREIAVDLSFIGQTAQGVLIEDGESAQKLRCRKTGAGSGATLRLTMPPAGGFVYCSVE
jgi:hypothetical protein